MFKGPWNSQGQSDLLGEGEKYVDSISKEKKLRDDRENWSCKSQKEGEPESNTSQSNLKSKILTFNYQTRS